MAQDTRPIPFEEFVSHLSAVFDQVERQEEPVTVERDGRLFVLRPKARRARKPRHLTPDEPLLDILGMRASGEPGNDVARDKYKYVADAIAGHFEHRQDETLADGGAGTRGTGAEQPSSDSR